VNEQLKQQFKRLLKDINGRPRAEKVAIFAIAFGCLLMAYVSFVYDPLRAGIASSQSQITSVRRQISNQQQSYASLLERSAQDPNRPLNDRLTFLAREQARLDDNIAELAGDLVTPSEMTTILTSVLRQFSGLELLYFANVDAVPLRDDLVSGPAAETVSMNSQERTLSGQVYSHGLTIEFEGDFFSTLEYLRFLEEVAGSFFWDSIRFRQTAWPDAHVTLEIHTLSTNEGFIGA